MTSKNARPIQERLASLINRVNGCWEFTGSLSYQGYGRLTVGSREDNTRRTKAAHIVSYEAFVGPMPKHLELDHLCRNKACINPAHLEPVTQLENIRRSVPYRNITKYGAVQRALTHCKRGHELDYMSPTGMRGCTTCRKATSTKWRLAKQGV